MPRYGFVDVAAWIRTRSAMGWVMRSDHQALSQQTRIDPNNMDYCSVSYATSNSMRA
ncbi:MAG: hypothetical protein IIA11_03720 [Proteobacteria bacterium]|nr:hypothetical protein [Pseudomonadota bacterium]